MNELLDNATLIVHAKMLMRSKTILLPLVRPANRDCVTHGRITFNPRLASNIVSLCYDDSAADRSVVECWTQ